MSTIKKHLCLCLTILISQGLYAQIEKEESKVTALHFEKFYNANQTDSIYHLFSGDFQEFLPLQKTREYVKDIKIYGKQITKREFLGYKESFAVYKTTFMNSQGLLYISSTSQKKINGIIFEPVSSHERNSAQFSLPFKDEWTVFWGGDIKEQNYHISSTAQKFAFDFIITDVNGKSFQNQGTINEDYYAFGKELFAPTDGEVVMMIDGVKDNLPGEMNSFHTGGNTVIIKTGNNEFIVLCHFKQHSIKVKEGSKVKKGQLLGKCGNSGNSSEPHLHFHIQDKENINKAIGLKCHFEKLSVNGNQKKDYSPVKDERIKRIN